MINAVCRTRKRASGFPCGRRETQVFEPKQLVSIYPDASIRATD
jgi:hypothetical protein